MNKAKEILFKDLNCETDIFIPCQR